MAKEDVINKKEKLNSSKKKNKKSIWLDLWQNKFLYVLALPAVIYTFVYGYMTLPYLVIAFENYKHKDGLFSEFVGLKNFKSFFSSTWVGTVTFNTVFLNVLFILTGLFFAVFTAILLNEIKHKFFLKVSQSVMLFPYFVSWVIVSYILYGLLNTESGFVNKILISMGFKSISFYTQPQYWTTILVLLRIWKGVGYGCIIYLATITGLDDSYFEAADIDGASRVQKITKIMLPLLLPTISVLVLMDVGRIFSADFDMFYAIIRDNGSLMEKTEVIDTYVFRIFKNSGDFGLSMAVSLYQSVVGFVLVLGSNMLVTKYYPEGSLF